jgi:hypothetical protein
LGITETEFAVLVFASLIVQGLILSCVIWYIRVGGVDRELRELTRKVADLSEDSLAFQ